MSVLLSVTGVLCAKTVLITAVINTLLECSFHLVSEKVSLYFICLYLQPDKLVTVGSYG